MQPYQYGGYTLQAQSMGVPNAKYKTMLCRHYEATKQCSVGSKCQFAHGQTELRAINDPLPPSAMSAISQAITQPPPQHNYKSIQCKYYANGFCKNGANCTFIHDDAEVMAQQPGQMMYQPQYPQGNYSNQSNYPQQYPQQQQQQPMYDQYAPPQLTLDQQVLLILLQNLEGVFPARPEIITQLRSAASQVYMGSTAQGSQLIKDLMQNNTERTQEEKQKYQEIYDRAKQYYAQQMQQMSQQ